MLETSQPVHNVLYWSHCRCKAFDVTDIEIMRSSIRNNAANGLTGFLYREAGFYVQLFEGPKSAVEHLHKTLLNDRRHYGFQLIFASQSNQRLFVDWSMGYSNDAANQLGLASQKIQPSDLPAENVVNFLQNISVG
ncbi:BLUF domain-containing protein [uncultured Litoreibacter sp.]|uniref:BLUF domain-containing protein n=1 Tax=uncultured Litoreibacter sp. TaxID=1392394 RepID=UPI00343E1C53